MAPALGGAPSALGGDAPGAPLPGVGVGAKRPRSATPEDPRRPLGSAAPRPPRDDANARAPASDAPPSPPRPAPRGATPRTPSGDGAPPARLDARAQTSRPPRRTPGEEEAAPSEGSDPSPCASSHPGSSDPRDLERDLDRAADAGEDNLPGAAHSEPPPSAASAPPDDNDADDPSTASPRDDSSSAPPLPAWLAADVEAALRFEPATGAPGSASAPGPPPARPGDPGWDHRSGAALSPAAFDAGEHGAEDAPEAFEVDPDADPCDVLRGRVASAARCDDDANGESVRDALSRRGAVKIAAPDAWDLEANASTLCDVRWLRDCGEKLGRFRGHFSLLQQTLPGRGSSVARGGGGFERGEKGGEKGSDRVSAAATVTMSEDLSGKAAFNLTFGELVAESDRRFRAAAQPYSALGAAERERAFLRTLRARLPAKAPYLSSVALEALEERRHPKKSSKSRASTAYPEEPTSEGSNAPSAAAPSKKQPPPRARPRWDPSLVADGRESILREMLDECERRCAPGAASREDSGGEGGYEGRDAATKTKARRGGSATDADGAAAAAAAAGKDETPLEVEGSVGGKKPATWGAGIISPWLYLTSVGSVFCCHIEDYAFGSANVILAPPGAHAWAAWYSVPRRDIGKLHEYLRGALGAEYALDCLEQRKLWLDPASVAAWRGPRGERIEVYRHLQGPGEYVATDYGAAHWGVNLGVGWKAAVNFAFGEWRAAAEGVHEQYRKLERATGLRRNYRSVPDFEGKEWELEGEEEEELEGDEGRREGREGARALRLQVRRIRRVFGEARRDEDDAVGEDDRDVDGGTAGPKVSLRPRERSRSRSFERGKPSPPPPFSFSNAPGGAASSKASKGQGRTPSSSAKEKKEIRPWTADELARLDGAIAEEEAAAAAAANEAAARGFSATSSSPGRKFAPGYSERVAERVGTRSAKQVRDKLTKRSTVRKEESVRRARATRGRPLRDDGVAEAA